jgi:hypothetical protein
MNKHVINGKIYRWLLLLQELDLTILDKPSKENVVAYFLCHLENNPKDNLDMKFSPMITGLRCICEPYGWLILQITLFLEFFYIISPIAKTT